MYAHTHKHRKTYIYAYIHTNAITHTHKHEDKRIEFFASIGSEQRRIDLGGRVYKCIDRYKHTHTHAHTCIHIHIHTQTHTYTHTHLHLTTRKGIFGSIGFERRRIEISNLLVKCLLVRIDVIILQHKT